MKKKKVLRAFESKSVASHERDRLLVADLQNQQLEYAFDRLRYEIEAEIARPFVRKRYDAFGVRNREANWQTAKRCHGDAENWRVRAYGVTFVSVSQLGRRQSEFRSLNAECLAFLDDFNGALRELRLAVSALDPHSPTDQFYFGIIYGLRAEVYLLRADAHIRRRSRVHNSVIHCEHRTDEERAVDRRRRAREDLQQAGTLLATSQRLIRDIRWNVSRRAWLYETRAQLVVEQILLRSYELDFEIDVAVDDWKLIGSIHRELTDGLESIRAALDCAIYPHHLPENQLNSPDGMHIRKLHKRLLALWMNLMVASFWTLRFLSVGPTKVPQSSHANRHAPRLAAIERFSVSGSRDSFWNRWTALNQAAGLRKLVETSDSESGSSRSIASRSKRRNAHEYPGDVAWDALMSVADVGDLLFGTEKLFGAENSRPPCMLREFILEKMRALYRKNSETDPDWVDRLQKALSEALSKESSHSN